MKNKNMVVQGVEINVATRHEQDYISLTDMLKAKDGDFFISDWLRNRYTIEFLGIWESICKPSFNYGEFAIIKSQVGLNSYKISVKKWVEKTHAIAITQMRSLVGISTLKQLSDSGAQERIAK